MATTQRASGPDRPVLAERTARAERPVLRDRRAIAAVLAGRDVVVAGLIDRHGLPPLRRPLPVAERFGALVRAICSQQLAGPAAQAIHGRLVTALGGQVSPEAVLALSTERLGGAGLSGAKAAALRDLAERVTSGAVALGRIGRLGDEEVVEHLVQVRGVGRWTAEMFLLSTLGRGDVWPVGDLGVRSGFATAWGLAQVPSPQALAQMADHLRPYRSTVAWYCWRVVDGRTAKAPPTKVVQRISSRTALAASTVPELR